MFYCVKKPVLTPTRETRRVRLRWHQLANAVASKSDSDSSELTAPTSPIQLNLPVDQHADTVELPMEMTIQ